VALILVARGRRKWGYMPQLALLTAFVFLLLPVNHAERDTLTQGVNSWRQSLNELTASSLDFDNRLVEAVVRVVVALLALAGVVGLLRRSTPALMYMTGGSLAVSLVLVWVTHWKTGAAFPQGGAIYLIPMVTLFAATIAQRWGKEPVEIGFVVVAAMLVAHYADHTRLAYRGEGDLTGGRDLAKALRKDAGLRGVRVAVSGPAEPILRYYRWRYRQANWGEIQQLGGGSFDYYVLTAQDAGLVQQRGLKVLYRDPGLVLAK
jgi:hypothetical protein